MHYRKTDYIRFFFNQCLFDDITGCFIDLMPVQYFNIVIIFASRTKSSVILTAVAIMVTPFNIILGNYITKNSKLQHIIALTNVRLLDLSR